MTYDLLIGERAYSSWSLRGGMLFAKFDIDANVASTKMYEPSFREDLKAFAPARTVPVVRLPEGGIVMDTLAIAETLNDRHPDLQMWPADTAARPEPLDARAIETGTPENDICPYSGLAITHLLELDGRIFGFCNAFCRDKTVNDAAAWPKFMALL